MPRNFTLPDLTQQPPFERWTVLRFAGYRKGSPFWTCQCLCGTIKDVRHYHLVSQATRSCGCLNREIVKEVNTTHGKSTSNEYKIWGAMIRRCESPESDAYFKYGGRGITVCERWHDFMTFYNDMGPRPTKTHTLERKDNNGPYSPDNCVWSTPQAQARNTRRNIFLTYNNVTQCAKDWAPIVGIQAQLICYRKRVGWSDTAALTTPATHANGRRGFATQRVERKKR